MLLPASLPKLPTGFDLRFLVDREGTTVELRGPPLRYEVFTLVDPKRLVLDLVPLQETKVIPERKVLRKGVVYRRFGAVTEIGTSAVHVLEFDPGSGAFRVVGASGEPRTLSELAEGAFAAINAGYFDTETFSAIGFLEVDDGLLSLPSRNRASVGFGAAGAVIDRVAAEVTIRVNGGAVFTGSSSASDSIAVSTATNLVVGTPRVGVITVANGVAQENKIGPRAVPKDGFALTYPAETRALALVNPGDRVALEVSLLPRSFNGVRYAVEAGPLLVASGHPALQPERESFQTGQRILDAYTQQAAIGLGGDGKVFFVVAEAMNAAGLVPLLISLGIRDAMRLDSGSSTMMLADGQLLNRAQERRVVSAIVFLPNVR
jgi:exopolysaccharide biosynthesis protein